MTDPLKRYIVTYVQECTQPVDAPNIKSAAVFASDYAHRHRLSVLSIYPHTVAPPATLPKPTAA